MTTGRFRDVASRSALAAAALSLLGGLACVPAAPLRAQEFRSPFGDGSDMGFPVRPTASARPAPLPPVDGRPVGDRYGSEFGDAPPRPASARIDVGTPPLGSIERSELEPLDGFAPPAAASAPPEPNGTSAADIEALLTGLELPPRSPALAAVFRRLFATAPAGTPRDVAVRIEALYRAGMLDDAARLAAGGRDDPVIHALAARTELALGRHDDGCQAVRLAGGAIAQLPGHLAGMIIAAQGYCAARRDDLAGASLAAQLARESENAPPETIAILDAVANGVRPSIGGAKRLSALDFRLLQVGAEPDVALLLERGEPAVLAALSADTSISHARRIRAAEAAAVAGIIEPLALAAAWRAAPAAAVDPVEPPASRQDPGLRRAGMLRAAESERTPFRKARLIRAFLDEARREGLYHHVTPLLAQPVEALVATAEIGWFAETAVEILIGAGRYDQARRWVRFADTLAADRQESGLSHWLAMIDIAEAGATVKRGETLGSVEDLALRGRFGSDTLHRLATVLDALDYNVPVRLWEAASRTPQPEKGHLPETGVLTDLQAAAKRGDGLAIAALAMRSIGPGTAEQANILALGDTIRALRRAGFEGDARRLGYEALVVSWPRSTGK